MEREKKDSVACKVRGQFTAISSLHHWAQTFRLGSKCFLSGPSLLPMTWFQSMDVRITLVISKRQLAVDRVVSSGKK